MTAGTGNLSENLTSRREPRATGCGVLWCAMGRLVGYSWPGLGKEDGVEDVRNVVQEMGSGSCSECGER